MLKSLYIYWFKSPSLLKSSQLHFKSPCWLPSKLPFSSIFHMDFTKNLIFGFVGSPELRCSGMPSPTPGSAVAVPPTTPTRRAGVGLRSPWRRVVTRPWFVGCQPWWVQHRNHLIDGFNHQEPSIIKNDGSSKSSIMVNLTDELFNHQTSSI